MDAVLSFVYVHSRRNMGTKKARSGASPVPRHRAGSEKNRLLLGLSKRKSVKVWKKKRRRAFLPKSSLVEGEMAVRGVDADTISLLELAVEDLQT
jgi:hypothetical protein